MSGKVSFSCLQTTTDLREFEPILLVITGSCFELSAALTSQGDHWRAVVTLPLGTVEVANAVADIKARFEDAGFSMTVLQTCLVRRIRRGPVRGNPQRQHEDCVAEASSSPAHKVKKRSQSWLTQGAGTWEKERGPRAEVFSFRCKHCTVARARCTRNIFSRMAQECCPRLSVKANCVTQGVCALSNPCSSFSRIMPLSHLSWSDLPPFPVPQHILSALYPSHSDEQQLDPRTGRSGRLAIQSSLTRSASNITGKFYFC